MAKTSKTMLNNSGESGHSCLVPDFRGNAFTFSPLRIMFPVGLSYIAFIMLRYVPSISFSALIAVAKTSRTMLDSSGESGHPCLLPDFRGNAFNFSPLRIMFAVCLSYIAFIMLRYVPSIPESKLEKKK